MQVEWNNNRDPTKGFKYLWLSDTDYTSIAARADTAVLKAEPFFAENGAWQMHFALGNLSAIAADTPSPLLRHKHHEEASHQQQKPH